MKKYLLTLILVFLSLSSLYGRWGWGSHRFINDAAVDHLPESMAFFQDHRGYLYDHSIDPDTDNLPGNYHYIDIDYYPEFFTGTLPHEWQDMVDLYGENIMEDNGLVPWVIEWWLADMTTSMESGNWNDVWQIAAELGHYVADSHQALHLTLNYNGQFTNNYGIHSRYETQMINPHLDGITLPDSIAAYWDSPIDSVFNYIQDIYPIVDLIMAADDRAYQADPNHNDTYFTMMWEDLGDTTIWSLNRAVVDLASIWYTAWVNAGSPYPQGVGIDETVMPDEPGISAYPNPFNGQVTLEVFIEQETSGSLKIYDLGGRLVSSLAENVFTRGDHTLTWNGLNTAGVAVNSGVYLMVLNTSENRLLKKLTLLK